MINEKEIIIFVWNLVLDKIKNHLEPFSGTVCRPGAPAAKLKQSLLLNYIIAVSYTHLDVYQRQAPAPPLRKPRRPP